MDRRSGFSPIDRAYLCPAPFTLLKGKQEWLPCDPSELFAWSQSFIQDSRSYLRLQPAYKYIADGMDLINGDYLVSDTQNLSSVKTDSTVRNTREIVAAQTNLRIIPAFKCEYEECREQNQILNKGFIAWQNLTFADRRIRGAWQYASAAGTGYIGARYDPNFYWRGRGDMVWDVYGPLDVLPLGLPPGMNLQGAYAVGLRKRMPIHEVWRMFPLQRDNIKAERTMGSRGMVIAQAVKFASAVIRRWGQGQRQPEEASTWDNTEVFYIYVDDDSVNETGVPREIMGPDGRWGTSWSYTVPFVGQKIASGKILANGEPEMKTARREDCLLYPNRRLIIATESAIINPNPEHQSSYRWDGRVPIAQLRADDWAWNFLGFPVTRYGQSLEKMAIELWRGINDQMNLSLNPPAFYDRGSSAQALLQTINPRIPGLRTPLDMSLNQPSSQFMPMMGANGFQWYRTDPSIIETAAKILPGILKEQMGVADVSALSRARQLPSGDSTEKLLEAMGPLVKDQSRNMEESIRFLGELWKSDFFQFWTSKRRMQVLGPEGVTEEDFDFDPGTMIPMTTKNGKTLEMTNGPDDNGWSYHPGMEERMPSLAVSAFERARWHKNNFSFTVTPYSLHEFNSTTRKLFMLQLLKSGFPLSWWTQAELFDVKNFGPCMITETDESGVEVKREARNEIERYVVQLEIMARIAQATGGGGQAQGKKKVGSQGRGHPQTFAQPPVMETKSSGDPIVRTSTH